MLTLFHDHCVVQVLQPLDLQNAFLQTATDATLISRSSTRLRVPRYAIMYTAVALQTSSNDTDQANGVTYNASALTNSTNRSDSMAYVGSNALVWPSGGISLYNDFFLAAASDLVRQP